MPKLPDPNQIQRETPRASTHVSSISPGHFSATPDPGYGEGLSSIAKEMFDYGRKEQTRLNDLAFQDAKNGYLEEQILEEQDYLNKKGKAAFDEDIVTTYGRRLDKVASKYGSNLKTPEQKQMWETFYGQDKIRFKAGVLRHKITETDRYAGDVYKSTNLIRVQDGANNFADNDRVNKNAKDITENVFKEAARQGWDDERTAVALQENLGALWGNVINKHLSVKQYDIADSLLAAHGETLGPDVKIKFGTAIKERRELDTVMESVTNYLSTADNPTNKDIMEHFATEFKDRPDLRKQAITEAKAQKTATDQAEAEVYDAANQTIATAFINKTVNPELIKGAGAKNTDTLTWLDKYDVMRTKGVKYLEDPAVTSKMRRMVNTEPENVTDAMIWANVYTEKGYNDETAQAMQIRRDTALAADNKPGAKTKKDSLNRAHKAIDNLDTADVILSEDPTENVLLWSRFHENLDDAYEEAEASGKVFDPVEFVKTTITAPIEENKTLSILKRASMYALTEVPFAIPNMIKDAFQLAEPATPAQEAAAKKFAEKLIAPKAADTDIRGQIGEFLEASGYKNTPANIDAFIKLNQDKLK